MGEVDWEKQKIKTKIKKIVISMTEIKINFLDRFLMVISTVPCCIARVSISGPTVVTVCSNSDILLACPIDFATPRFLSPPPPPNLEVLDPLLRIFSPLYTSLHCLPLLKSLTCFFHLINKINLL